ncbi:hypothetical protein EWF20_10745 [Sulfolobus sp. S-194]|uniref:hypothetical protein n=1 Tax=Sulfolobus sp. S-194 TaxID=2512240 RepID=UPI001437088E|nr:hypothetical protein [Sulfolobus sp. S-194]QIW24561.1 hypothetical protein EWF20_10745 [Sulfolobus sp. S-194]
MKKVEEIKGYKGHIALNEEGKVIQAKNLENEEEWANVLKFNVEKGNEEAKELGFNKMNGFAMIGSNYSLAFMKGLGVVVDTRKADWQELFIYYTYSWSVLITGIVITALSIILFGLAFTSYMSWLAPEPRFYLPAILLIVGIVFLAASKSSMAYRL